MKRFVYLTNYCVDLSKIIGLIACEEDCVLRISFESGHLMNIAFKDYESLCIDYNLLLEELGAVDIVPDEDETEDVEEEDE